MCSAYTCISYEELTLSNGFEQEIALSFKELGILEATPDQGTRKWFHQHELGETTKLYIALQNYQEYNI